MKESKAWIIKPTVSEVEREVQCLLRIRVLARDRRIERQLLNETISSLTEQTRNDLSITEARSLLPEKMRDEIRLRARNQAWESLVSEEVFDRNPLPEAVRISDTISHLQEYLQDRASIARTARNDLVKEKARLTEKELEDPPTILTFTAEDREQSVQTSLNVLSATDAHRMSELDRYAAQTREDVYRGFELLDTLRRSCDQVLQVLMPA